MIELEFGIDLGLAAQHGFRGGPNRSVALEAADEVGEADGHADHHQHKSDHDEGGELRLGQRAPG